HDRSPGAFINGGILMRMTYSSRRLARFAVVFASALVSACASVPIDESSVTSLHSRLEVPTSARRSYITADEVEASHASSMLEMIRTLRPEFLRASDRAASARPAAPALYLNGTYFGDVSWLSTIAPGEVQQVEFVHPAEARARFGPMCRCDGGVLHIRIRA